MLPSLWAFGKLNIEYKQKGTANHVEGLVD